MEKQVSCLQETFCSFLILGWWNWFKLPGTNSLCSGIYSKFPTPPSIPDGLPHGHKGSADTSLCCVPASPFLSFLHDCQRPPSIRPCRVPAWSLWGYFGHLMRRVDSLEKPCGWRHNTKGHWHPRAPWRRAWQPTPVFLPGVSHGRRSLSGYSPWGHKQSDMTERLTH